MDNNIDIKNLKLKKVLYVEDDVAIMNSCMRILNKLFAEVITAQNGEEGLDAFKLNKDVSFVITDIKMPKMDGLDMAEEIKKINSDIPCILTTAHGEYDYFLRAEEIGIYRYIQKPLNINELITALSDYKE
ncbi:MAG: response regulator [Campylobacterota bacterium]|nr:response regulator [Campylobacterota bacterium]